MPKDLKIEALKNGTTAVIKISGTIHKWLDANARSFEIQVDNLIAQGCTNLLCRINSDGGDPVEANQMGIILMKFPGTKEFEIESIAASAATVFLHLFDTGSCYENSLGLLHEPTGYFEGKADEIEASAKLLRLIRDNMIKGYAVKMNKTETEVADMIKSDYWMDAKEMLKLGIINKIIKSKAAPMTKAEATEMVQMYASVPSTIAALANSNAQNSTTDMSKLILLAVALQMTGEAAKDEDQIILKATESINAKAGLEKIIAEQKAEIEALKNAEQTKALNAATAAIEAAVKDNKITVDQKKDFEAQAKVNPDFVVSILAAMKPHTPLTAILNQGGVDANKGRESWDWREWQTKDSVGLSKMKAENFAQYSALFEAKFGNKPNKG